MAFFSMNSGDYISQINSLKKPTYESKYENNISSIMDAINNRKEFSYDFNADPLYQNMKDQYTKLGKEAALNAASSVSNLTGGYGNSYAATAASQANQQYLTDLNSKIPELASAAMDRYKMQTEDLYNKFGMYQSEENRLYGQHRDSVSDYYSDWSNLLNGFGIAQAQENADRTFNYQVGRDQVSDSQWDQTFKNNNDQWNKQFEYQTQRDAVADQQWEKEYQLALQKAKQSGSSKSGTKSSDLAEATAYNLTENYQNPKSRNIISAELDSKSFKSQKVLADYLQKYVDDGTMSMGDALQYMDDYQKRHK